MPKNRRPSKDDGCCSVHFLKYVLFIFNFLFYLAGLAILGIGLWTHFFKSEYVALLASDTYSTTTYILIGAGGVVLLIGIIGCVGVLRESRWCLLLFTFLLLLVFLAEAVAGVLAYIYSEQIGKELSQHLNQTFATKYGEDDAISKATESLHLKHKCCGADLYADWQRSKWFQKTNTHEKVAERGLLFTPEFCCITPGKDCATRDHPSNIYYTGCLEALKYEIQKHEIIIGAVALGVSTVQIFGMVLSCCLFTKLKDFEQYKTHKDGSPYY